MRALLDVNVLIALLDAGHVMHRAATAWLEREIEHGWASCPITENGVVRIMSQPAYPASRPTRVVAARLAAACRHPSHAFWAEDVSLLEPGLIEWSGILAHRQVTEAYLLALAVRHGGRLAAFDRRIAGEVVPGARAESLVIIA
jgi:toxin-antitoxin system PIN domain toxin